MPVYLSLFCWRPAVIRPPSLTGSAEKQAGRDQKDQRLVFEGSDGRNYAAGNVSRPSSKQGTVKSHSDGQASEMNKEKADHVHHKVNTVIEMRNGESVLVPEGTGANQNTKLSPTSIDTAAERETVV